MIDLAQPRWRKSTRSNNAGQCVEVAAGLQSTMALRDSKDPDGPYLVVRRRAWSLFVESLKAGAFDAVKA